MNTYASSSKNVFVIMLCLEGCVTLQRLFVQEKREPLVFPTMWTYKGNSTFGHSIFLITGNNFHKRLPKQYKMLQS